MILGLTILCNCDTFGVKQLTKTTPARAYPHINASIFYNETEYLPFFTVLPFQLTAVATSRITNSPPPLCSLTETYLSHSAHCTHGPHKKGHSAFQTMLFAHSNTVVKLNAEVLSSRSDTFLLVEACVCILPEQGVSHKHENTDTVCPGSRS